ncbi:bifunctional (p)ppGpp synthetase/guanosine-3',5'-bis(diphosphate) 3'-pyrophosphohydrolase [Candidatus Woesearchaeota archaeon]|nr:bifunctional (p)ppGpp synthetase/guanosine-3',5'-bis(diphosphate) 3'-pyrophosphohydrolase [Candidatus Woesearchaeota archaeon]
MDVPAFLAILPANGYSSEDSTLLQKAITLAAPHLALQKRLSGESIFQHNLRVAEILCDLHADAETLAASLLHGLAPEEYLSVERELGVSVIALLKGLDGLKELKFKNNKLSAEALRKIILTTVSDVRIITIKLANKIDNLSTLGVFPENEQRRIASEVLDIYAPLAYRLGLEKLRVRLEDAAFKMINPRKYKEIQDFLEDSREQREQLIEESITLINSIAEQKIPIVKIKGRSKHIYSIYRKMTGRGVKLNEQYDLLGIRVIVPTEKDCYTLLGLLHEKLEPVEERLKDYIANPKPNLYRSIHTAVLLPNGRNLEIQIRTPEMDEFAEEGLAAHWRYKGLKSDQIFEKKMAWLKSILELQKTTENKEFLETIKVDLFGDTIYCYTPKGDIKELPRGAVLLDFAYTIHEEVGNHAVGGRVNGIFVPLKHPLASGDVIDILTNKNQRPRRSWIKIVTSPKSRQKIRKELKTTEHLSPFHFRQIKPAATEEQGILVQAPKHPTAQCELAQCCRALPGEEIIGIATKRRIISVHRRDCRLAAKEEKRWLPVQWKETFNQRIRFVIQAQERSGLLADMLHTIASAGFEVKEAKAKLLDENLVECSFVIIPRSLEQIQELIGRLRKVRGWKKIYFA